MLQSALHHHSADPKAWYYLGNYWYAAKQYHEAIDCWQRSIKLDAQFSTVLRNLAIACFNKLHDKKQCLQLLEKAFALDPQDSRLLLELDQLYRILNYSPAFRLEFLNKHRMVLEERDDLYLQLITLYNNTGDHDMACSLILNRNFHPWEGGEGKVIEQYLTCYLELAKTAIHEKRWKEAMALLEAASHYPVNLGEGKLYNAQVNAIDYLKGLIYHFTDDETRARQQFERATAGGGEPGMAIYYNDANPDQLFYQAMAWKQLGKDDHARSIFERLVAFGEEHLLDDVKIEYFAVSLPDLTVFDQDLSLRSQLHCHYLIALGALGLQQYEKANEHFREVFTWNLHHQGAIVHQKMTSMVQQPS